MPASYTPAQAAALIGVSVDTVRRWCDRGDLTTRRTGSGRREIDGPGLANFLTERPHTEPPEVVIGASARNRFPGIVTGVVRDEVVARVEIQAGPHRVVSLMTAEAVDELGLTPGMLAVASIKSTNVVVEVPEP